MTPPVRGREGGLMSCPPCRIFKSVLKNPVPSISLSLDHLDEDITATLASLEMAKSCRWPLLPQLACPGPMFEFLLFPPCRLLLCLSVTFRFLHV